MNMQRFLIICLILFGLAAPAAAQIKRGKAVQIMITGVPQEERARFEMFFPVGDNGMVNMPFIGEVKASGKKAETLAKDLQRIYKEKGIYTNPTFQVIENDGQKVDEQLVIVGGHVKRAGPTPFFDRMTLWQAIQAAGGPDMFGSMKRVELVRNGERRVYNCEKQENRNIRLVPGDSVNVPEKDIWGR
ncbi:MAG: polysaccharide biosynthesis/export family protein [Akkermansiaceae bacterium]|nr:polysaccharide biosynthesis/export family protein [Akkermansiaceae bacterium]